MNDKRKQVPADDKAGNSGTNASRKYRSNRGRKGNSESNKRNLAVSKDRLRIAGDANCWKAEGNDPRWYAQFPHEVANFANFNFKAPVGSEVRITEDANYAEMNADRYPGVMALYFCPSFGWKAEGNSSALNLAANRLYQFTRFENNGSSRYDRGDLMLYMLAMDSVYMFWAWVKRLYGEVTQFSNMNRYLPKAIMRAERVDYDSLEANLAQFRAWINQYADKLSMLPIPNSMSYMARHSWMANSLFVDEDTVKCQFYLFVPQYYCVFRVADGTGTLPAGTPWLQYDNPSYGSNALTFADIKAFGDSLLLPLVTEEDFNLIGADIIKAFGSEGVVKLTPIPDDYKTVPVFSEEVLDQIENSVAIGHPACYGSTVLPAQNNGAAVYWDAATNTLVPNDEVWVPLDLSQTYQLPTNTTKQNKVVNFTKDTITNDDIMVATRLTNTAAHATYVDGYYKEFVPTLGSEFVCQFSMFFFTTADTGEWRIGNTTYGYFGHPVIHALPHGQASDSGSTWLANTTAARDKNRINGRDNSRFLMCLSQFRRHPQVYLYDISEFVYVDADGNTVVQGYNNTRWFDTFRRVGDTANFAVFNIADLINLSSVALMSEFYVPLTASGAVKVGSI